MSENPHETWDPRSPAVLTDQIGAYDRERRRCPVRYSDYLGWSVFRHGDVRAIVEDHVRFSNAVSVHLNVPSGMDSARAHPLPLDRGPVLHRGVG